MRVASIAVVVCLSVLASYAAQSARTSTGVVFGKVTNSAGAPLGGATVKLTGGAFPTRTTATGTAGDFRFADVPFGTYVLDVSLPAFVTLQRPVLVSADFPQSSPVILTLIAVDLKSRAGATRSGAPAEAPPGGIGAESGIPGGTIGGVVGGLPAAPPPPRCASTPWRQHSGRTRRVRDPIQL